MEYRDYYAVEFRTKIIDGIIELPEKYRNKIKCECLKVILLTEDNFYTTCTIDERIRVEFSPSGKGLCKSNGRFVELRRTVIKNGLVDK